VTVSVVVSAAVNTVLALPVVVVLGCSRGGSSEFSRSCNFEYNWGYDYGYRCDLL